MSTLFELELSGGRPNSLGRTADVVARVVADGTLLDDLFATIASEDAVVRMRVGDALEKVCRERPDWFAPRVERILDDLGPIATTAVRLSRSAPSVTSPRSGRADQPPEHAAA